VLVHEIHSGYHCRLQVARGPLMLNATRLDAGGGTSISNEGQISIAAQEDTGMLLFEPA
jgi:hypothetical protein